MEKNYWRRSSGSQWSRRTLLTVGGQGAVGLAALALIGCSSGGKPAGTSGSPAAPGTGGAPAVAGMPKRGGTIKAVYNYDVPTYDIHSAVTAGQGVITMGSIYSGLLRFKWEEPWKVDADLAQSWENPNPLQWTFKLRSGVKWHDGTPFSSEDAVYNLPIVTPFTTGPLAKVGATFEAPDATTLVIKLKRPAPYLLGQLGRLQAKFNKRDIVERKALDKEFVGTGPWKFERREPGQGWYYTRNPDFYLLGKDGKPLPYADKLSRVLIADVPAEISAISTGQVHTVGSFPALLPSQIEVVKRTAGNKVVVSELANGMSRVFVNSERAPFNDRRVRMAAHLAMDRTEIVRRAYEGALVPGVLDARESGEYALTKDELAAMPGFRAPKDKDLADAKALLAAAGFANGGPKFELVARQASLYVETLTVTNDNLQKVGFRPDFQAVESSVGITRQAQGNYDMGTVLPAGDTDPLLLLQSMLNITPGATNHVYIKDNDWIKNVVDRLAKALESVDKGERIQAAKDVQKYVCSTDSSTFAVGGSTGFVLNARELKDNFAAATTSGESFYEAWLDL